MVVHSLNAAFSALSDPTRRAIVERLAGGPATVNDLAAPFQLSQQAISKHLVYLERARLIKKRRDGRKRICSLEPAVIKEVSDWTEGYRRLWEERYQRLDVLLESMKGPQKKRARRRKR